MLSSAQKREARRAVKEVFSKIKPPLSAERTQDTFDAGFAAGIEAAAHAVPEAFVAVYPLFASPDSLTKEGDR